MLRLRRLRRIFLRLAYRWGIHFSWIPEVYEGRHTGHSFPDPVRLSFQVCITIHQCCYQTKPIPNQTKPNQIQSIRIMILPSLSRIESNRILRLKSSEPNRINASGFGLTPNQTESCMDSVRCRFDSVRWILWMMSGLWIQRIRNGFLEIDHL
jgi:hypothetical protein